MASAQFDIILEIDNKFITDFTWFDRDEVRVDVSDFDAVLYIKKGQGKSYPVLLSVSSEEANEYGMILVEDRGKTGTFTILINARSINKEILPLTSGEGWYQLDIYKDHNNPIRLSEGRVKLVPSGKDPEW